jgi:hypothetical protein
VAFAQKKDGFVPRENLFASEAKSDEVRAEDMFKIVFNHSESLRSENVGLLFDKFGLGCPETGGFAFNVIFR